jgi:high affinity Mn2+ porin
MATLLQSTFLKNLSTGEPASFRARIVGIYTILVTANLLAWAWALVAFAQQPILLGTALLAYSLGLRHALDADHIAAIDNVTRTLMQEGKRPVAVGFFFALGHSTVVVLASLAVALAAHALTDEFAAYREIGGIIGTSASALFLFVIAMANVVVLRGVYRAFRRVRSAEAVPQEDIDALLQQRGWLARLFRPLFRFVSKSWHLYPIGLLFALGFETASEISLFGLSAEASNGLSGWSILIFPTLFAAAMTLIDTTDGILMLGAYGWAYRKPIRKLFYNLTITSVSVLVALVIGGIQTFGLLVGQLHLQGSFWDAISELNGSFGVLGYGIVALFVASWVVSIIVYRCKGYDRHEMQGWKKLVLAVTAFTWTMGDRAMDCAMAADVVDRMPVKSRAASVAPYDWTGFYVGGHVGYGRGHADAALTDFGAPADNFGSSFGSLTGGIQIGYNYILPSRILLGVEADASFLNYLSADDVAWSRITAVADTAEKVDYMATLRGRLGYVFPHWIIYATGGYAWSLGRYLQNPGVIEDIDKALHLHTGWAVGGGTEFALSRNWTARLEYLYASFGHGDVTFPSGTSVESSSDVQSMRFGLNYKIGAPSANAGAGNSASSSPSQSDIWEIHTQTTYIQQGYPAFRSPYVGPNSLTPWAQTRNTWTASAFLGLRLWDGGELYYNPELLQGFGLHDTTGAAGFPNGEAQKSNFPYPRYSTSRLFFRQTFGFGGGTEAVESGFGQMAEKRDVSLLTVQVGRFAVHDWFDTNSYAQDPRSDFMNWSLWASGAFDYPADKIGLGYGTVAELKQKYWALRVGYFLTGNEPNTNEFDMHVFTRGAYVAELITRWSLFSRTGKLRVGIWEDTYLAGSYSEALDLTVLSPGLDPTDAIIQTRRGRTAYGYYLNFEQPLSDYIGLFGRWSWNNGKIEISAFTDIDNSVAFGAVINGKAWGRPDDRIGIAGVTNGLSDDERAYLAAGGLGILIGDGQLNYRRENIVETYYAMQMIKGLMLTFDYQFMMNPAYNADRGPISIFSGRLHGEF